MALHFSREEFARRQARAIDAIAGRGLDGLLVFRQESMYYLTGVDTFGYVFFLHPLVLDSERGLAMAVGETVRVTGTGCERLSRAALDLVVN